MNFFKKKKIEKNKFVYTTRNIARSTGNGDRIAPAGGNSPLGDFYSVESILQNISATNAGSTIQNLNVGVTPANTIAVDARKSVEPKEVFDQIKRDPLDIDFKDIDIKIIAVEERIRILSEHLKEEHLTDEHRSLFYLKNRRTYLTTREKKPLDWAMTTQEAVDNLCGQYKLKIVPLKQFYTLVPAEGIKEMDRYTKAYKAITGDNPIFELVIKDVTEASRPEKKAQQRKDRDPILLANSPLGNHLFIIGVWDEEVAVVDEIIYHGK